MSKAGRSKRSKPRKSERGREPAAREAAAPAEIPARIPAQIPAATPGQRLVRHAVRQPGTAVDQRRTRSRPSGRPGGSQRRLRHRPDPAGRAGSPADAVGSAAGASGPRRPRGVVSRCAGLGSPAAQGTHRVDEPDRPVRGDGRPHPAVSAASPAVPGRGPALRAARVRPPRHRGSDAGPAAGRQGDGAARRPDHGPLPRGDADPGRTGTGSASGGLARPVPDRRGSHGAARSSRGWSVGSAPPRPDPPTSPRRSPSMPAAPFSSFVSSLVALRLRELLTADLRLRGGEPAARRGPGVRGGRHCAASWTASAACWTRAGRPTCSTNWTGWSAIPATPATSSRERMTSRLRGERYLSLLDQLVVAARGGRIGDVAAEPTHAVLTGLVADVVARMTRATDRLAVDGPARAWDEAWAQLNASATVDDVVGHLYPVETARRRGRIAALPAAAGAGAPVQRLGRGGHARGRRLDPGGGLRTGSGVRAHPGGPRTPPAPRSWSAGRRPAGNWTREGFRDGHLRRPGGRRRGRQVHPARPALRLARGARGEGGPDLRAGRHGRRSADPAAGPRPGHRPPCGRGRRRCCTPPTRPNTSTPWYGPRWPPAPWWSATGTWTR